MFRRSAHQSAISTDWVRCGEYRSRQGLILIAGLALHREPHSLINPSATQGGTAVPGTAVQAIMHGSYELLESPNLAAMRPGSDSARHPQDFGPDHCPKTVEHVSVVQISRPPNFGPGISGSRSQLRASSPGAQLLGRLDPIRHDKGPETARQGLLYVVLPAVPSSPSSSQRTKAVWDLRGHSPWSLRLRHDRYGRHRSMAFKHPIRTWLHGDPAAIRRSSGGHSSSLNGLHQHREITHPGISGQAWGDKYRDMPRTTCLPLKVVLAGLCG
jgi:hypothetical protein